MQSSSFWTVLDVPLNTDTLSVHCQVRQRRPPSHGISLGYPRSRSHHDHAGPTQMHHRTSHSIILERMCLFFNTITHLKNLGFNLYPNTCFRHEEISRNHVHDILFKTHLPKTFKEIILCQVLSGQHIRTVDSLVSLEITNYTKGLSTLRTPGFSPVWIFWCVFKVDKRLNSFPHVPHCC